MNDSVKIPPGLRYDLRSPTPSLSDVPTLTTDRSIYEGQDVEGARAALMEVRHEYETGEITLAEYQEHERQLSAMINALPPNVPKSLAKDLSKTTHTRLDLVDPSNFPPESSLDIFDDTPTAYLDPTHEDEMLATIDNYLATAPPDSQPFLPRPPRMTEKEKEKVFQLHNPVSVYNWLQKHSTKVITHDIEKEARHDDTLPAETVLKPRPSPKPSSSVGMGSTKPSRKRASSSLVQKQEPEELMLDDEGYVIGGGDEPAPERKKRKRDDDAYRPKGGSSRARKRTKGSSGAILKKLEPDFDAEEQELEEEVPQ